MTCERCSGCVPRSASHMRRQLRISRATGAIARVRRDAAASMAGARPRVLDAMSLIRTRQRLI